MQAVREKKISCPGWDHTRVWCGGVDVWMAERKRKESPIIGPEMADSVLFRQNHLGEGGEPENRADNGGFGTVWGDS